MYIYIFYSNLNKSDPSTSPAPNNNRTSILGNLYDDPAIVHVIEHAREAAYDSNNKSSENSVSLYIIIIVFTL